MDDDALKTLLREFNAKLDISIADDDDSSTSENAVTWELSFDEYVESITVNHTKILGNITISYIFFSNTWL